jgi:toxin ParE1/3/4
LTRAGRQTESAAHANKETRVSLRYRLTPEARANIDDICAFIAEDNVEAAIRVLDALEHAFGLLAANPAIGHVREDLTNRPVKFWPVYKHLVVYDPSTEPVTIIAPCERCRPSTP